MTENDNPYRYSDTTLDRAERSTNLERATAAIEGAVEGAAEAMEQHGLPAATHRAIDQMDKLARAGRRSSQSDRPSRTAQRLHEATGRATAKVHEAQTYFSDTVQDVRHKAHAVAETTRRAADAPAELSRDLGKALNAWMSGMVTGIGLMAGAAVAGIFGLVLLTMALVAGLATAIGMTGALLVVGILYAVATIGCLVAAKAARVKANAEARGHVEEARRDLERVTAPVREAFASKPTPPTAPLATTPALEIQHGPYTR